MRTPTNKPGARCGAPTCTNFAVTTSDTQGFCQGHFRRYQRYKQLQLAISAYNRRGVAEDDPRRVADIADYDKIREELGINE